MLKQASALAVLLGFAGLTSGCPSATVAMDAGFPEDAKSAAADSSPRDAGRPNDDAAAMDDDAAAASDDAAAASDDAAAASDDATTAEDAAAPGDAGGGPACAPPGRQYLMAGTAQNPQRITFGAGLPTERTVEFRGAYLASFGPSGCFEWLARMEHSVTLGGVLVTADDDGNIYFASALPPTVALYDSSDRLQVTFTGTVATSTSVRPSYRGALIGSYDRLGRLRWVDRIGNTAARPNGRGYQVASLEIAGGALRVVGGSNGGTRLSMTPFEVVFGASQPTAPRVTLAEAQEYAFSFEMDRATGVVAPTSLRLSGSRTPASNSQLRHNGEDTGAPAADGAFMLGVLTVGSNIYQLNRGQPDQVEIPISTDFVAAFVRYTANRTIAWHRLAGNSAGGMSVFSSGIAADGSSLFSGNASAATTFDNGSGATPLPAGAGAYLVRYDAAGNLLWLRGIAGRGLDRMLVDDARGAVYAIGTVNAAITFGVGDADAVTVPAPGVFVARFSLQTGALEWIRTVEAVGGGGFSSLDLVGDELVASARADGNITFQPGLPDAVTFAGSTIWSGNARYRVTDGAFLGAIEYVRHAGTRLNDGLNRATVYQP